MIRLTLQYLKLYAKMQRTKLILVELLGRDGDIVELAQSAKDETYKMELYMNATRPTGNDTQLVFKLQQVQKENDELKAQLAKKRGRFSIWLGK